MVVCQFIAIHRRKPIQIVCPVVSDVLICITHVLILVGVWEKCVGDEIVEAFAVPFAIAAKRHAHATTAVVWF